MPRHRPAMTLIELLVVIAIIAILIGLLVPAVQKVRGAVARAQCANNMKQIALAMHAYHDTNRALPPAVMMNTSVAYAGDAAQNFGPNWAVLILPYVEQGPLYSQVASSVGNYMRNPGENAWRSIRGTPVAVYTCPSDNSGQGPFTSNGGNWARGNYAANSGPGMFWISTVDGSVAPSSPLRSQPITPPYSVFYPYQVSAGPVMGVNLGLVIQNIPDGSSNTVLLDEIRIGPADTDLRGVWAMGQVGASITAGAGRLDTPYPNFNADGGDDIWGCTNNFNQPDGMGCCSFCTIPGSLGGNNQAVARSRHPEGVNTAFADGSVRFMRNAVGQQIWYLTHSANDGQPVQID